MGGGLECALACDIRIAEEQAKERKSLGVVFPNTNKENPKSYDLKGTITLPDGKKYRIGGYKAQATGTGGLLIEQDGTGDAVLQFLLTGTKRWIAGIDNSDSDKFKIANHATNLHTNTKLTLQTDGNLGIGTITPNARLDVSVDSTSDVRVTVMD